MTTYKCNVLLSDTHGSELSTTISASSMKELAKKKSEFLSLFGKDYKTGFFSNVIVIERKEIPETNETIEL